MANPWKSTLLELSDQINRADRLRELLKVIGTGYDLDKRIGDMKAELAKAQAETTAAKANSAKAQAEAKAIVDGAQAKVAETVRLHAEAGKKHGAAVAEAHNIVDGAHQEAAAIIAAAKADGAKERDRLIADAKSVTQNVKAETDKLASLRAAVAVEEAKLADVKAKQAALAKQLAA